MQQTDVQQSLTNKSKSSNYLSVQGKISVTRLLILAAASDPGLALTYAS
jgi:hypothetical protein